MFKPWIEMLFFTFLVCVTCPGHMPWCSGMAPKNRQTGVIVPLRKKGDSSECTKCRNPSLVNLPEKVYDKCLTNDVPAVALQTKFSQSRKCLVKILGVSKGACTCFSNSRQNSTEFIWKRFRECCRSTVLTASCYWTFKSLHSCSVLGMQ